MTTDSNPRACALDPRAGTALVLAEGVANLACVGATPVAVVNCLNFGNPEHPEVMWQLSECIDGMAEACRALSLPVIGGQRQLLQRERRVRHRPHAGARGARTRRRRAWRGRPGWPGPPVTPSCCSARGRRRTGPFPLEGTRWATERRAPPRAGRVPAVDFAAHAAVCAFVAGLVAEQVGGTSGAGLVQRRARRVGRRPRRGAGRDGGRRRHGMRARGVETGPSSSPSCPPASSSPPPTPTTLCARAAALGIPAAVLGRAGGDRFTLGGLVDLPLDALREAEEGNLARALGES